MSRVNLFHGGKRAADACGLTSGLDAGLSGFADRGGAPRRSPVEIVATMGSYLTRTQAAEVSGLRAGPFGRWADGVTAMRGDCAAFARHWQAHNDQVLAEMGFRGGSGAPGPAQLDGPLWVVLGDSTAQGLGALSPDGGYVGQVLAELRRQTGLPWRVLNLSVSGSLVCQHQQLRGSHESRRPHLLRLPVASLRRTARAA